jgi:TPR repeat protein
MINFNVDTQLKIQLDSFRVSSFKKLYFNQNIGCVRKILPFAALGDAVLLMVCRIALIVENFFKGLVNLIVFDRRRGGEQLVLGTGCNVGMLIPDAVLGICQIFNAIYTAISGNGVKSEVARRWQGLDPVGYQTQQNVENQQFMAAKREEEAQRAEKFKNIVHGWVEEAKSEGCPGWTLYSLALEYHGGSVLETNMDRYWELMERSAAKGCREAQSIVDLKKAREAKAQAEAKAKADAEARTRALEEAAASRAAKLRDLEQTVQDNPQDRDAWFALADMYYGGSPRYYDYMGKAAALGHASAQQIMNAFHENQRKEQEQLRLKAEAQAKKEAEQRAVFESLMEKYKNNTAKRKDVYAIACCYRDGVGVQRDFENALKFRFEAAKLLHVEAMKELRVDQIDIDLARHVVSKFTPRISMTDYDAILPFVEVVAKRNKNPVATFYVAYQYAKRQDWESAKSWFLKLKQSFISTYSQKGIRFYNAVCEHENRIAGGIGPYYTTDRDLMELFKNIDSTIYSFEAQEIERQIPSYQKVQDSLYEYPTWPVGR